MYDCGGSNSNHKDLHSSSSNNREDICCRLFIGGLSPSVTSDSLRQYFSQYGTVLHCNVPKDPKTQRSKGYGFLTYKEREHMDMMGMMGPGPMGPMGMMGPGPMCPMGMMGPGGPMGHMGMMGPGFGFYPNQCGGFGPMGRGGWGGFRSSPYSMMPPHRTRSNST